MSLDSSAAGRLIEEGFYEKALNELKSGELREGLWGKALATAMGDEQKARSLYLKYRVQAMIDDQDNAKQISEQVKGKKEPHLKQEQTEELQEDLQVPVTDAEPSSMETRNHLPSSEFSKVNSIPEDKLMQTEEIQVAVRVPFANEKSSSMDTTNYLPLSEFSKIKSTSEDKLVEMIRKGFYSGRIINDQWYVHVSEFNNKVRNKGAIAAGHSRDPNKKTLGNKILKLIIYVLFLILFANIMAKLIFGLWIV